MEQSNRIFEFPDPFKGADELDDELFNNYYLRTTSSSSTIWRHDNRKYERLPDDAELALRETQRRERVIINEVKESIGE